MGILRILSERGDEQVAWDAQRSAAGDPEAQAAVEEAERIFAEQRARGATAYQVAAGEPPIHMEEFNAAAEQIIVVPRVTGG